MSERSIWTIMSQRSKYWQRAQEPTCHLKTGHRAAHKPRSRTTHRPENWLQKSTMDGAGHNRAAGLEKLRPPVQRTVGDTWHSGGINSSAFGKKYRSQRSTEDGAADCRRIHSSQSHAEVKQTEGRTAWTAGARLSAGSRCSRFRPSLSQHAGAACMAAHPGERTEGKRLLNQTQSLCCNIKRLLSGVSSH